MTAAKRILVVDDEAAIRTLMSDILTSEGFKVEFAEDGSAALDMLQDDDDFELMLTDIMMPEMDGIELIRQARQLNPALIPIVMTGFATVETARDAVREGAYDYVLKPFSLGEIKMAVANAQERSRLVRENSRLRVLSNLFNVSERIAGIHEEQELLDFVLYASLARVNASRGSIMYVNPDGNSLRVAASVGLPNGVANSTVNSESSISGHVVRTMQPLLVDDVRAMPDLYAMSQKRSGAPSFISLPLIRKRSSHRIRPAHGSQRPAVAAVLNVCNKEGDRPFDEGDLNTLKIMANHTAVALENVNLIQDIEDSHLSTLHSMTMLIEAKDPYTLGHSDRVAECSVLLAQALGMCEEDVEVLRLGAMLHDIGKIGVRDAVLNKTEKLTDEEWDSIKRHPLIGYEVLVSVPFLSKEHLELVRSHHERLDGRGYPDGLTADQLSPLVRVIAIADAYDAMASNRAYRRSLSRDVIIEEIENCSGTQFDPDMAKVFVDLLKKRVI